MDKLLPAGPTNIEKDILVNAINLLCELCYNNAVNHKFMERMDGTPEPDNEFISREVPNIHAEVSELWEAYRGQRLHEQCDKAQKMAEAGLEVLNCEEEELADIIIRTANWAKRRNVDLGRAVMLKHAFNITRSIRHGGKIA